jgi:import inner membrane translocase subunit TIM21
MLRNTVRKEAFRLRCLSAPSSTSIMSKSTFVNAQNLFNPAFRQQCSKRLSPQRISIQSRKFSDKGDPNADGADRNDIVLTPGEKVAAGTRLTMFAGAAVFACICGYYIVSELIPTKMAPNSVFNRASKVILENDEVKRRFGEPMKVYGREHGGHREGRRNFIEHSEFTDKDDGSKRTRVRFNLQGQYGNAFVFAEVSKDMASDEFVYLLVQDRRNGAVITVIDNRSRLMTQRMAGGDKAGQDVLANLLGSGKN